MSSNLCGDAVAEREAIPKYTAPPIIEAIIQFVFVDELSEASYRKIIKRLGKAYANHLSLENIQANLDLPKRQANFTVAPQEKFSSEDQADILLVNRNALTWSRLAPYPGWDVFFTRVKRDLEEAHQATGYRKLGRLGVRFINRLDVPRHDSVVRYEEYLAINISLPEKWDVIQNYGWRFERDFPGGLRAIVQSAIVESEVPETGAFMLDIDVVALSDLPTKLENVFTKLSDMRTLKNEIFETSITDLARESFRYEP